MQSLKKYIHQLQPHLIPILLLCITTMSIYAPSLTNDFLSNWDDRLYLTSNEAVRGISASHIAEAFSRFYVGNYAPLQIISYMLDYELWGMKPFGFILSNILIHIASGLLYYRLLVMMNFSRLAASASSFIFLLHPVQVESVVWISQRKNILAMLFFLCSLIFYLRFTRVNACGNKKTGNYAVSLTAFVGALLSKSVAIVLPVVLILYDICYQPHLITRKSLKNKIPYLLIAILIGIITVIAQKSDINDSHSGGRVPYHGGSLYNTMLTMLPVMLLYLKLVFYPLELNVGYSVSIKSGVDWQVMCGGLTVVLMIAIGVYLFKKYRELFFWYSLIFICLIPVSQIIPLITLINDRYLYFPMLGIAALAGKGVEALIRQDNTTKTARLIRPAGFIVMILLMFILPWMTIKRSAIWKNSITLWEDAVTKLSTIDSWFGLANAYHANNDLQKAKWLFMKILDKEPNERKTLYSMAFIYMQENDLVTARVFLLTLTKEHPEYARGFIALGNNYYMTNDMNMAEKAYLKALLLQPEFNEVLPLLGNTLLVKRDLSGAARYLTKAMQQYPRNPDISYSLACLRSLEGKQSEALFYLEKALEDGYNNKKSLTTNSELDTIRNTQAFTSMISRYLP